MDKEIFVSQASKDLKTEVEGKLADMKTKADCIVQCEDDKVTKEYLWDMIHGLHSYFESERNYMNSRINDIWESFYNYTDKHAQGHAPKMDAAALSKFIKSMGLEDTYQIVKQPIFVQASRDGKSNELIIG